MRNIDANSVLSDPRRIRRLLALEKQRRGVHRDRLVFVGMHNVARHWWCTQEAVFKSRANEDQFFAAYLYDRIKLAQERGLHSEIPRGQEAILEIGDGLTYSDAEKQFRKEIQPRRAALGRRRTSTVRVAMSTIDDADDFEDPFQRGDRLEALHAEKYPTFRWNFPWKSFVVVGVPDGITKTFVYEYKTTRNRYLFNYVRPIAFAQGDLYAYFFMRPSKRVQIEILEERVTETYQERSDKSRAEQTLNSFAAVEAGASARPPKPWKCRGCEYRNVCPISQAN